MIYADNAATTKMSEAAVNAMISVISENYGNPSSLYSLGQSAKEILEEARGTVAEAIGAEPRDESVTARVSSAREDIISRPRRHTPPRPMKRALRPGHRAR